jgi:hypothetical protein
MVARLAAILLLVLLHSRAAAGTPRSSVPEGLHSCVAPETTPDGWVVGCDGAIIGMTDLPVDGKCRGEECLDLLVTGFNKALGSQPERHETTVMLAGESRRLVRLDGVLKGERRVRVFMAILDRREGRRVLTCFGAPEHESRCHTAFEAMASLAWRAGIPSFFDLKPRPMLVGRAYDAPPGCSVKGSDTEGMVDCGRDSRFAWKETRDAAAVEVAFIQPFSGMKLTETRVDCAIEGTATTCRSFRPSNGGNIGFDVAHALVRDRTVVVLCANLGGTAGIPRACSGVLIFRGQALSPGSP